jgi:hypothetical protein
MQRNPSQLRPSVAVLDRSVANLHLVVEVPDKENHFALVCEFQPLITLKSHGLPKRCPFCRQQDPIGSEINH